MQLRLIRRFQDRAARTLGLKPERRAPVVAAMLAPRTGEAAGYWLQLLMAAALATLGLALDSTAVVIGAMLIAPLMRPIVELAMGLATGSSPLAFRAGARSVLSITVVVGAAAAISWSLPFREVTGELAARTAPSLLDLFVAAACALVGAYATMFATSDMASTAAGTSIGISLVPPLCTLGYGISIGDGTMAVGAGLLFTANITGILLVASLVFVVVGFGQVGTTDEIEAGDQAAQDFASRLGRRWSRQSKRLGAVSRLVLPLLLLAAIWIPLRRAVGDMSTRSEIRRDLGALLGDNSARVAQSSIEFDAAGTVVRIVIVGDNQSARLLEQRVKTTLAEFGESTPRVSVWAVPDASSLGALARRLDEIPPTPTAPEPEPPRSLFDRPSAEIGRIVGGAWPVSTAGVLVSVWIEAKPQRLRVVHLGPPIGPAGMQLLAKAIAPTESVTIEEDAFAPVDAGPAEAVAWLPSALALIERARVHATLSTCVSVPAPPKPDPARPRAKVTEAPSITNVRDLVKAYVASRPHVALVESDRWTAAVQLGPCVPAAPNPEPAPADKEP